MKKKLVVAMMTVAVMTTAMVGCGSKANTEATSHKQATAITVDQNATEKKADAATVKTEATKPVNSSVNNAANNAVNTNANNTAKTNAAKTNTAKTNTTKTNTQKASQTVNVTVKAVNESVTATSDVNIRSAASTNGKIVGTLKKGAKITRTGVTSNGWSRVAVNGKDAYICNQYLTKTVAEQKKAEEKKVEGKMDKIDSVVVPEQKEEKQVVPEQKEEQQAAPEQKEEQQVVPEQKEEQQVVPEQKEEQQAAPEQKAEEVATQKATVEVVSVEKVTEGTVEKTVVTVKVITTDAAGNVTVAQDTVKVDVSKVSQEVVKTLKAGDKVEVTYAESLATGATAMSVVK